jgi:hypothetical protein
MVSSKSLQSGGESQSLTPSPSFLRCSGIDRVIAVVAVTGTDRFAVHVVVHIRGRLDAVAVGVLAIADFCRTRVNVRVGIVAVNRTANTAGRRRAVTVQISVYAGRAAGIGSTACIGTVDRAIAVVVEPIVADFCRTGVNVR